MLQPSIGPRGRLLVGAAAVALLTTGSQAFAQTPAPAGPSAVDEVVVTGSRIPRRDYTATSPIVTVQTEALQQTNRITVEETLNQLPQMVTAGTASTNSPGSSGQATANLRGLGPLRTMVLLDGRRLLGSSADGTVDLNLIPDALIQGIEVITGGASATYGSDAMAGVVNFKLVKKVEGVTIDAQYGDYSVGDGASQKYSVIAGKGFADGKGNLFGSYAYSHRDLVHRGDRPFYNRSTLNTTLPDGTVSLSANPPTQAAVDAVFAGYGFTAGTVLRTQTLGFNADGTLFTSAPVTSPVTNYKGPRDNTVRTAQGTSSEVSGNTVFQITGTSFTSQNDIDKHSVYGHGDYALTPDATIYLDAMYTKYDVFYEYYGGSAGGLTSQVTFPVTNPFIPAALKTLLASRATPAGPVNLVKQLGAEFGKRTVDIENTNYNIVPGIRGSLPYRDWTYDAYATFSKTNIDSTFGGAVSQTRYQAVLNAADGGRSVCTGGYNPFGNLANSQSCIDYLKATLHNSQEFEQKVFEADFTGTLFTLPAGEAKASIGASYRSTEFATHPDVLLTTNDAIGYNGVTPSSGDEAVKEIYGEVLLPIFKELPLINSFNVGLGYRYSKYNNFNFSTYKADFDWAVVPSFRFRGGYQRAARAPSLAELYNSPVIVLNSIGNASAGGTAGDPCDVRSSYRLGGSAAQVRALCIAQGVPAAAINTFSRAINSAYAVNQGNPNLTPEVADTFSFGAVWRSQLDHPLVSGLSASIDYYSIKITDAIGNIPVSLALSKCFNADGSNPTYSNDSIYCKALSRDPNGDLGLLQQPTLNLAEYSTKGIDFTVDWKVKASTFGLPDNAGTFSVSTAVSRVQSLQITQFPGAAPLEFNGTVVSSTNSVVGSAPKWKATTTFGYKLGPADIALRWRYIDAMKDITFVNNPATTTPGVPAYSYFDINARYQLTDKITLRAGVNNVADKEPPVVNGVSGNTDISLYDVLGRAYFVGLKATF